jgi:hypothetical protein
MTASVSEGPYELSNPESFECRKTVCLMSDNSVSIRSFGKSQELLTTENHHVRGDINAAIDLFTETIADLKKKKYVQTKDPWE